jgi:hypothetical protein
MLSKSILTVTAIALVAGLGSASAADQFSTIAGFEARVMTDQELDSVTAAAGRLGRGSPNPNFGDPPWSALVDNAGFDTHELDAGKSGVVVLIPR